MTFTKAERLAIGGAVAPIVRRQAMLPRKVTLVGKDGLPVGVATSTDVATSLLARNEIEFSVQDGERPEWVKCQTCARPIKVKRSGVLPTTCRNKTHKCACGRPISTAGCGFGKSCIRCTGAARLATIPAAERSERSTKTRLAEWAALTPEQRSERGQKMMAKRTPEQRRDAARVAGKAAMTKLSPEQRAAKMERMHAALTPEVRRENAAKMRAATTPEQRSEAVRKMHAGMTPEQKAARNQKLKAAWAARRPGHVPHTCACGASLRSRKIKQCRECWETRGARVAENVSGAVDAA